MRTSLLSLLPLLTHIASRMCRRYRSHPLLERADLIQEGWLAVLSADAAMVLLVVDDRFARRSNPRARARRHWIANRIECAMSLAAREALSLGLVGAQNRGVPVLPFDEAVHDVAPESGVEGIRLTRGDWHALRAFLARVLAVPEEEPGAPRVRGRPRNDRHFRVMLGLLCERRSLLELADELRIAPVTASNVRGEAIRRLREHLAA